MEREVTFVNGGGIELIDGKKKRRSNLCNQRVKNIAMTVGEMLGAFTAEVSLCKASIPPSLELGDNPPYLGITFFLRTHFCYSEQHV